MATLNFRLDLERNARLAVVFSASTSDMPCPSLLNQTKLCASLNIRYDLAAH